MVFLKVIIVLIFLFPIQNIFTQEIDKALYQRTTLDYINHYYEIPEAIEYYKFDGVYVERFESNVARKGNEYFKFFELDGTSTRDRGSSFQGLNTLSPGNPGQFVTIYLRVIPGSTPQKRSLNIIDHIEIPAEDFFFTATHKTSRETNIWFAPSYNTLLTIDTGVEVQVLGPESYDRRIKDGDNIWVWLVTGDGYGGWVYSPNLESLEPKVAVESLPSAVAIEPEPLVVSDEPALEAEQSSRFPLSLAITGLSAVLLVAIIVVIVAKWKKKKAPNLMKNEYNSSN